MCQMTSSLVVGLAAVAAWALVAPPSIDPSKASSFGVAEVAAQATPVNRAAKADRIAPSRAQRSEDAAASTLENRDAATIYRDSAGRVLFQADPLSKVTVISKGFVLPQLTGPRDAPHASPGAGIERPAQAGPDRLRPAREPDLAAATRPSDRPLPGPKRERCRPRRAKRLSGIGVGARVEFCGWRIRGRARRRREFC